MNRRDVLAGLTSLSMAGLCGSSAAGSPEIDSAVAIGRWLLSQGALPTNRARLIEPLLQTKVANDWTGAVRCDFAAGRIISVEGWQISDTEARLCALAALVHVQEGAA